MEVSRISFGHLKKLNFNGESYKHYSLKKLTTFKIGGNARYYLKICTIENFLKVMLYLKEKNYPFFVIGNGSNILASDSGYDGVIIKLGGDFDKVLVKDDRMECGAGVMLSKAYTFARDSSLSGLECSVGIPATIGGAVCMNASAYDFKMSRLVDYVVAFNGEKITYLKNTDCKFGYRESIFQHENLIILRVGLILEKSNREDIERVFKETLVKRKSTQPQGYGNAGCIFRRENGINVSKMLDDMGVKGRQIGGGQVSQVHANFILNYDNATSSDIIQLIKNIQLEFEKKYNIKLHTEIKFLGDFNETCR